MKSRRFQQYLQARETKKANPARQKEEIPGPHSLTSEANIKPKTTNQKKTAGVAAKDGEKKITKPSRKKRVIDEQESDGSANAFDDK